MFGVINVVVVCALFLCGFPCLWLVDGFSGFALLCLFCSQGYVM